MKTKKLILILPFLFLIITPLTFASAECSWETITTQTTYSMPGVAPVVSTSGGCSSQQSKSPDNLCSNIVKPTFSTNSNQSSVCCCAGAAPTAPKKPLFVMPVPEVTIPTVKLTEATCELNPQTNTYVCAVPWIGEYINGIYKYGINIAGILAALVLMGGGLLWLISGGDASKITKAKEMIIGSVTGLIILMSSYIILTQINPDLVKMKSISLGYIAKQDAELAKAKLGSDADLYAKSGCPSDTDLTNGVQFYATGYFKMPWQASQDKRYLCMVHMQGTCPNGVDTASICVENGKPIFSGYPNYQPCLQFNQAQYNSSYFNQANLIVGQTIAGPIKCGGELAMGKQVCFNGHTYTITDSGGGIQGKRIDILSSSEAEAINNTKTGLLKSGPCK